MLGHLRRCPTSLLRLRITSPTSVSSSRPLSLVVLKGASPSCRSHLQFRALHQSSASAQAGAAIRANVQSESPAEGATSKSADVPLTTFRQLAEHGLIDKGIIQTLTTTMRFDTMTEVQKLTINEALKGVDILAQAKTGTGKTLGFLLPIVQNILNENPALAGRTRPRRFQPSDLKAIVISPTRELAEQIAEEALKVTRGTSIIVQTAVGGTQKSRHLDSLHRQGCSILVGTPGRLKDVLSDPRAGVSCPSLNSLVLDEADRLLDMGFWPEIQEIQQYLPTPSQKDRQTLMFSATIPNEIVGLARSVMKPGLHYVRTVQTDEIPTTEKVRQKLVVVPSLVNQLPAVLELCNREIRASLDPGSIGRPFKAIVYFNTTMETDIASQLFRALKLGNYRTQKSSATTDIDLGRTNIYSIHSRLNQGQRTTAAESFRRSKSAILMSSDVTARGMDFPGVTHVIQVGLPKDPRDTYVHRIGRTARAGQEGEGWLIVNDTEVREVRKNLRDLPLKRDTSLKTTVSVFEDEEVDGATMPEPVKQHFWLLNDAAATVPKDEFAKAYYAMMNAASNAVDKDEYVSQLNALAKGQWGIEIPGINPSTAQRLGLRNVKGLKFRTEDFSRAPRGPSYDRGFQRSSNDRRFGDNDRFNRGGGGNYRDRGMPRDGYPPRNGGRQFGQDPFSDEFSSRGRGDRGGFGGAGRGFDRGQRGDFNRSGNSGGRGFNDPF